MKSFFSVVAGFFQISFYFFNNSSSFIKKDLYLVSSKSLQYSLIFGSNIHKGLTFLTIFVTNKIFKTLFTKENFIRYYYFINIYIAYRTFYVGKICVFQFRITNVYNLFIHFYIYLKTFSLFFKFITFCYLPLNQLFIVVIPVVANITPFWFACFINLNYFRNVLYIPRNNKRKTYIHYNKIYNLYKIMFTIVIFM